MRKMKRYMVVLNGVVQSSHYTKRKAEIYANTMDCRLGARPITARVSMYPSEENAYHLLLSQVCGQLYESAHPGEWVVFVEHENNHNFFIDTSIDYLLQCFTEWVLENKEGAKCTH